MLGPIDRYCGMIPTNETGRDTVSERQFMRGIRVEVGGVSECQH